MSNDSVVRARIDEKTKKKAALIFAKHGLTLSDGIRILLTIAVRDESIPISLNAPTRKTTKAMKSKKIYSAKNVEDLLKQLNA